MYSVAMYCSVYCFMGTCVMYVVLLPPGVNPIAVNKHISLNYTSPFHQTCYSKIARHIEINSLAIIVM